MQKHSYATCNSKVVQGSAEPLEEFARFEVLSAVVVKRSRI
jgi:hypothetical protein